MTAHRLVVTGRAAAKRGERSAALVVEETADQRHDVGVVAFAIRATPSVADLQRLATVSGVAGRAAFRRDLTWLAPDGGPLTDATYVPPRASVVPALIDDLLDFVVRDDLDPVSHAALVELQLTSIHPWMDGNGRAARALALATLVRRGLIGQLLPPTAIVLNARRTEHVKRKDAVVAGGSVQRWIDLYADCVRRAADAQLEEAARRHAGGATDDAWLLRLVDASRRRGSRLLRVFGLD